jgi:ribonucleoside-diphosphate reductase alpha chain
MTDLKVKISPNALTVLEKRYLKKDKDGQVIETPEEPYGHEVSVLQSSAR